MCIPQKLYGISDDYPIDLIPPQINVVESMSINLHVKN